ncbi:MAG TPA: extracellular solute-binding protein [Pseudonocardiaceae bacterium]|nr:extracellular solute-binding protein [Pseudonocardiaceae bacterium]
MHGRLRYLAVAACAASALLVVAGCGVGGGSDSGANTSQTVAANAPIKGSITFQTWSLKNQTFTPYFTSLIQAFQAKYPGTTINWIDQPGDGYQQKVASQVTSKTLPDVINLPPNIAYPLVTSGNLLDLTKNVPTLSQDYVQSGLDSYRYPGVSGEYGFPWYLGAELNFWNKAMFTKDGLNPNAVPKTLDDLFTQAKTMHDGSAGKDYLISTIPGLNNIVQAGGPLMNSGYTKFIFNNDKVAALLDQYVAAFKAGEMPPDVLTNTYQGNNALFLKQEVAWTTGQGNEVTKVAQTNPDLAPNIIPSPSFGPANLNVQGISVSAKSANLPLALAFAKFVTDNDNQVAFIKLAPGFLPGTTAAAKDPAYAKSDGTNAGDSAVIGYQDMQHAINYTPPVWTDQMNTDFNQQISLAISGQKSSKQALDDLVNQLNQLLSN